MRVGATIIASGSASATTAAGRPAWRLWRAASRAARRRDRHRRRLHQTRGDGVGMPAPSMPATMTKSARRRPPLVVAIGHLARGQVARRIARAFIDALGELGHGAFVLEAGVVDEQEARGIERGR